LKQLLAIEWWTTFGNDGPGALMKRRRLNLKEDTEICNMLMCPQGLEDRAELTSAYIVFYFIYDDVLETMTITEVRVFLLIVI
jgi:hypothetical protein